MEIADQPTARKKWSHIQRREEVQKQKQTLGATTHQLEKDPSLTLSVQEHQLIPSASKASCSTLEPTQICADPSPINQTGQTTDEKFVWNGFSMTLISEDPKPKKNDKITLEATNATLDFQAYLDIILPPPAIPTCLDTKINQETETVIFTSDNSLKSPQILKVQEQASPITKPKRKYQKRTTNSKSALESFDSAPTGGSGLPGFAASLNLPNSTSITYAPPPPTILQVSISSSFYDQFLCQ